MYLMGTVPDVYDKTRLQTRFDMHLLKADGTTDVVILTNISSYAFAPN